MDAAVERYLHALVVEARGVLGDEMVGAYAAGSVALDAYEPGRSDIDVAIVSERALTEPTKRELVQRLRHESLPCPARGLELVVYRRDVARAGLPAPDFELELNSGAGMGFRATLRPEDRPAEDGLFWYGLDRSILHRNGITLLGPPAAETFAELRPDDVRELVVASLRWWSARTAQSPDPTPGAEDAVLGACRVLVHHRSGLWLSKVAAGRRLVEQGHRSAPAIERALAARTGGTPPSGREARNLQEQVLREIAAGSP